MQMQHILFNVFIFSFFPFLLQYEKSLLEKCMELTNITERYGLEEHSIVILLD